ncbi:hypothetical protein [Faecalibacillus intestinalis]|uniref:hypothetical protein n=1 Tax=Faecalibacillus intestinalis TaxID=1982626 RepID=UPI003994CD9A
MNNIKQYKERKLKELSILNGYLNNKIDLTNCNSERYIRMQECYYKNLRNDNREKFYHHLTNNNQIILK